VHSLRRYQRTWTFPREGLAGMNFLIWLYNIDSWHLGLLIIGGIVAISDLGMLLTRRWVAQHWAPENNIVGLFLSAVGVVYAVLLAMVAVAVWENFNHVQNLVTEEASEVLNLFRDVEGLPTETRERVRSHLRDYVEVVIADEWPTMQLGQSTRATLPI